MKMYSGEFTLILLIIAPTFANSKDYKDFRLYKVFPDKFQHLEILRGLEWLNDVEFWESHIAVNRTQKVMVAPEYEKLFEGVLSTNNLKFKLLFKNLQGLIDKQKKRCKKQKFNWRAFMTLDEINTWLDELLDKYSNIVSLVTIGKSTEGRDLKGIIINYNKQRENDTVIGIIEGTIHAREWMSTAMVTWIIHQFLSSADRDIQNLAKKVEWHIFPVINPDGYVYTFHERRFWKKNRNAKYSQKCNEYGADDKQSEGVDLNRNFDISWLASDSATDNPCSNNFGGSEPLSEKETLSLTEYVEWKKKHAALAYYISFHAYSQTILIPYGHVVDGLTIKSPNYDLMYKSAKKAAELVKKKYGVEYKVGVAPDILYPTSSSSVDFMKYSTEVPRAYQVGLSDYRDHGYLVPPQQIIPNCKQGMDLLVEIDKSAGSKPRRRNSDRFKNPKAYDYLTIDWPKV